MSVSELTLPREKYLQNKIIITIIERMPVKTFNQDILDNPLSNAKTIESALMSFTASFLLLGIGQLIFKREKLVF